MRYLNNRFGLSLTRAVEPKLGKHRRANTACLLSLERAAPLRQLLKCRPHWQVIGRVPRVLPDIDITRIQVIGHRRGGEDVIEAHPGMRCHRQAHQC